MSPIELLIAFFITANPACYAHKAEAQRIGRQEYQVLNWSCNEHSWQAWQRKCPDGNYYSHVFYLQETRTQQSIYLDRFGGVVVAVVAQLEDMWIPACGA
jgi:hypothetical protein